MTDHFENLDQFNARMEAIGPGPAYGQLVGSHWGQGLAKYIPLHMQEHVARYVAAGTLEDEFLGAIVCGNLFDSYRLADNINIRCIQDYVKFFYNHAPSECKGSLERVLAWKQRGGMITIIAAQEYQD